MEKRKRHNGNRNGAMTSLSSAKRFLLSSLKALKASTATGRGLEKKSFKSLYELARKKGIKGRSKMTKKQLAKSLAQRRPL